MTSVKLKGIRVAVQRDGHGCGYCALTSIYRYYGLDPQELMLRMRLGTDNTCLPAGIAAKNQPDTRGTLPPDLLAVLCQDGFTGTVIKGGYPGCRAQLHRHLRSGHPALVLAGGMSHWLVAAGMDEEGVLVLDSCALFDPEGCRTRYTLPHSEFGGIACGLIRLRWTGHPRAMTRTDYIREYARGCSFTVRCTWKAFLHWLKP